MERTIIKEAFIFTIFGASGDLAKLKIFPAIYELAWQKRLPKNYIIYGYARSEKTDEQFRKEFETSVKEKFGKEIDVTILEDMLSKVFYFAGQYNEKNDYEKFFKKLKEKETNSNTPLIAYYSTPPTVFNDISRNLAEFKNEFPMRLVIEKPFGENEASARDMFAIIEENFEEDQVYLLDHYLGKESVQSITSMRYANSIINHLLKGELIKYIQITGIENIGIKERGKYFDEVGMIKDMIQSHLLQLLALITMSMPNNLNSQSIHREKYHILSALKFDKENFLIKGQYESYKNEDEIAIDSKTETYAALKLCIDQTEWAEVPIYIRTGKMVDRKHTYITIVFKKLHFQEAIKDLKHNKLIIELQPKANVYFKITNKHGGTYEEYHQMAPSQSLECFGDDCLPEHGRLLMDILKDERRHFLSFNEVIACWHFIDNVLNEAKNQNLPLEIYKDGSRGPNGQNILLGEENNVWHEI
ncbi:MAG: glucose-6-phosphate dehydrogenase [Candidatus Peregrinibacteria bacterium]|nr:glucose-6-phosphate dehydrogenase [Candidatus Peregrinibacteria bacterium]MDZ4244952.1 glucose-6-phosphate dehydrogenase [Candidatus Gracilibacteria bacterium]